MPHLRGTPGAQRGTYAYAGVGKRGPGAIAYCAPSKAAAEGNARYGMLASTSACVAIASGATCAEAKKAAKKAANAKCKPCRFFDIDRQLSQGDKWAIVERTRDGNAFVGMFDRGRATVEEIDRLSKLYCPHGFDFTPEENAIQGLRRRRR
jgi:hypothetical protein